MLYRSYEAALGKEDQERIDFFFELANYQGEPQNMEPEKCEEITWFDENSLPENMVEYVQAAIHAIRQGASYSEHGFG